MSTDRSGTGTTDDWLSAPVGAKRTSKVENTPSTGSPRGFQTGSQPAVRNGNGRAPASGNGATAYADNDSTQVASPGSLYPSGYTAKPGESPAASAPLSPGPATSLGLGSSSTQTTTTAKPSQKSTSRRPARGPRRAKLQIRHIDPWSTLKLSLVLAIAFFFVWMVAVGVLYGVLNGMGVFDQINTLFAEVSSTAGGTTAPLITTKIVFGGAALIGAINIVLFTALATVGTYIYNLCADLVGGLEITLAERR